MTNRWKSGLFVFPLAALLNSFSMTVLLLVFGIAGHAERAAEISLIQGATLALFYAFSANARILILADTKESTANQFLQSRLLLMLPLSGVAYVLSVDFGATSASLAVVLIVRRMSEWIGEIGLSWHEQMNRPSIARQAVTGEGLTLTSCLLLPLFLDFDLAKSAIPWALTPLLALRGTGLSWRLRLTPIPFRLLLPHFGSTAIIGTSVYIFRISIALLAGKVVAGQLFTAFAIGGVIPTVVGHALVPSLTHRYRASAILRRLIILPAGMLILATAITSVALAEPIWLNELGISRLFFLAVGLSIGGGALMCVAVTLRARLIQSTPDGEVFGPDLLANVLIAACVPFVYFVFGLQSLSGLYLLSGCLSLLFFGGADLGRKIFDRNRTQFFLAIGVLLIFPVFFQISGGLFRHNAVDYDAGGAVLRVPIPLFSIMAMFGGIALLGRYAAAARTLTVIFSSAVLYVVTALVVAQGNSSYEGAKLILVAQFLLPMFGLVLGQMYGEAESEPFFERAALWVLVMVLPAQLLATWQQGYSMLSSTVFFFSIYQHLDYFPMVVTALTVTAAFSLSNPRSPGRRLLRLLIPVLAVYVLAYQSAFSTAALIVLSIGLGFYALRGELEVKSATGIVAMAVTLAAIIGFLNSERLSTRMPTGSISSEQQANPLAGKKDQRSDHWRFYGAGIIESPRVFLLGHATPPDRKMHPSAHNYWLDVLYNFGAVSVVPLVALLATTLVMVWRRRTDLFGSPTILGISIAVTYLVLGENMVSVGMRQPYPGIITFFLWGLLIARLNPKVDFPASPHEKEGVV